jgi:hypothetical protein
MFTNKKSIIFLTKSKIKITSVSLGAKPKESLIAESDWNFDNLLAIILKHRKSIGSSARLLLSEDFVYVINLSFPSAVILNRDAIRQKAQEFIPEDLNETIWDYKEISERQILLASAVKELYKDLSKIIFKSGLQITTIEPLSLSLARLTKREADPILFIFFYDKAYLTLAQKEAVYATERIELPINKDKVKKFISFAKENYGITPKKIVFCGDTKDLNFKDYEKENFKVEIQDLSPTISLAYKADVKDKDKKVLSLELFRNFSISPSPNKTLMKNNGSQIFWILEDDNREIGLLHFRDIRHP